LVREYIPFTEKMAQRYWSARGPSGDDYDVILSDAQFGLFRAARAYNPDRGSFLTFAYVYVDGEIRRGFRDRSPYNRSDWEAHRRGERVREEDGTPIPELPLSLDATFDDDEDGHPLLNCLEDQAAATSIERTWLRNEIDRLPAREKVITLMYHFWGYTQDEIAPVLGLSQMQISRLNRRAIGKMREHLDDPMLLSA
jgi:RNA polymerase sporulation-specific sigma factor